MTLVSDFVMDLWKRFAEEYEEENMTSVELIQRGRTKGWLEEFDELNWHKDIKRQQLSRIIHEFLKKEMQEKDDIDIKPASNLKDLYDCHTCVAHVAQVYVKGIMETYTPGIFGMQKTLMREESAVIIEKIIKPQLRTPVIMKDNERELLKEILYAEEISMAEALKQCAERKGLLIDVRTFSEYEEGHLENAISHPMQKVLHDISCIGKEFDQYLYLYCQKGYQSQVVANYLKNNGYKFVYYFGIQ